LELKGFEFDKAWEMLSASDWDMNKAIDLLEHDKEEEDTHRYKHYNAMMAQREEIDSNSVSPEILTQAFATNFLLGRGSGI